MHTAGGDQLCLLGFHQSLSGRKMCLCFLKAPRDLFVNVTLVKSSATVSPVDATFSLEQRKTSGWKWQNNPLIFISFHFLDHFFGHLQARESWNWNGLCRFNCKLRLQNTSSPSPQHTHAQTNTDVTRTSMLHVGRQAVFSHSQTFLVCLSLKMFAWMTPFCL